MITKKKLYIFTLLTACISHETTNAMYNTNEVATAIYELGTAYTQSNLRSSLTNFVFTTAVNPVIALFIERAKLVVFDPVFISKTIKPSKNTTSIESVKDSRNTSNIEQFIKHTKAVTTNSSLQLTYDNMLLFGPPGNGKTTLVENLANKLNMPVTVISVPDLFSGNVENAALRIFLQKTNGILYFNEADSILERRETLSTKQREILTTFLHALNTPNNKQIFVLDTNSRASLDPGMLRRFPVQIKMENPTLEMREQLFDVYKNKYLTILPKHLKNLSKDSYKNDLDTLFTKEKIREYAEATDGACCAHIENTVKKIQKEIIVNGCINNQMIHESIESTRAIIERSNN